MKDADIKAITTLEGLNQLYLESRKLLPSTVETVPLGFQNKELMDKTADKMYEMWPKIYNNCKFYQKMVDNYIKIGLNLISEEEAKLDVAMETM